MAEQTRSQDQPPGRQHSAGGMISHMIAAKGHMVSMQVVGGSLRDQWKCHHPAAPTSNGQMVDCLLDTACLFYPFSISLFSAVLDSFT